MTPNEQKAAELLREWQCFFDSSHGPHPLKRWLATHIVPKLLTPDHEAALAACEGFVGWWHPVKTAPETPELAEIYAIGRRSLDAKKPKERWEMRFGHGMNRWFVYLDGEAVGRDFPADAEPEARAYVARKNAKEAGR